MSGRDGHARALVAPLQFQADPLAVALSAIVLVEVVSLA